jgi:uncharacterized membrane protein
MDELAGSVFNAIGLDYLTWKYVHIVSSTLLFGTGLGTAFHMFMSHRTGDVRSIVTASRNTVLADWLFTTPAVLVQPFSGAMLAASLGLPLTSDWLVATYLLYVLVGACWLPVVWLQIRMHRYAAEALRTGRDLPVAYHRAARIWIALGWPAFISVLGIFYLMLFKQLPI